MQTISESSPEHLAGFEGNRFSATTKFSREALIIERQMISYIREVLMLKVDQGVPLGSITSLSRVPKLMVEMILKDELRHADFAMYSRLAAGLGLSMHEIQESLKWPLERGTLTNSVRLFLRRKPKALDDADLQAFLLTIKKHKESPREARSFTLRDAIRLLLLVGKDFSDLQWFHVKEFR